MTQISKFQKYNAPPKVTTLAKFIRASMDSSNKCARQVQEYRNKLQANIKGGLSVDDAKDKIAYLKKSLPLVTFGCLLTGKRDEEEYEKSGTGYRVKEQIAKRTGWIALDIDAKDNPHLDDAETVRDAVGRLPFVSFSALSVSGMGVWALVKIEDPDKQARHFEQLKKDFQYYGITLDPTKGKHAHDLRYYSFDPDAYIADDFKIYDRLPKEKPTVIKRKSTNYSFNHSGDDTRAKVEQLVSKINTDITAGYENWLKLGFALEDEFGEGGRDYFHAISQYHSDYNRRECDRQYTHCLKHRGSGISIGTLFHVCKRHGHNTKG